MIWKFGFITVYSRTYQLTVEDLYNQYIQPILTGKTKGKKSEFKKIKLIELNWQSSIGLERADLTAIGVSLLWALKSLIVEVLHLYIHSFDATQYHVVPNYHEVEFKTKGSCIFSLNLGQAIYIKFKRRKRSL